MKSESQAFSSKWGFFLSVMGIAIGAGNIWRFPRIVAQHGQGALLIPWVIFLLTWSIPLIVLEGAIGRKTRKAPPGAIGLLAGKHYAWAGWFIAVVTTLILAYYCSVVGWGFYYCYYAIAGKLFATHDYHSLWASYSKSYAPLLSTAFSIALGGITIAGGVSKGIEKSNKILIPLLLTCLFTLFIKVMFLPGAFQGFSTFFYVKPSLLFKFNTWLQALTQNAWDTGAGWGLLLVYAGYAARKDNVSKSSVVAAFSNNFVSLMVGMIVFGAVYALDSVGISSLIDGEGGSGIGLTFIYMPKLFRAFSDHSLVATLFAAIFFLAFAFAALSSMISMLEVAKRAMMDIGVKPRYALIITLFLTFILAIPSAVNLNFFNNQDTVWGIALIVNGLVMVASVLKYGLGKFIEDSSIQFHNNSLMKNIFVFLIKYALPFQGIILLMAFFYSITVEAIPFSWNPFSYTGIVNLLFQWLCPILFFMFLNRKINIRLFKN